MRGAVEAIGIATASGDPLHAVEEVEARAGVGLTGDRYASERGEFSDGTSGERDITLIAVDALTAASEEAGFEIAHLDSRRNLLVSGIDVNALVGRRFRVGAAECVGRELAEPCRHLERLTRPGMLGALVHRGGLRAGITAGGRIAVGDPVEEL